MSAMNIVRYVLKGNTDLAMRYTRFGQVQLSLLLDKMTMGGLQQDQRRIILQDGTEIFCVSRFGQSTVYITTEPKQLALPEDLVIPGAPIDSFLILYNDGEWQKLLYTPSTNIMTKLPSTTDITDFLGIESIWSDGEDPSIQNGGRNFNCMSCPAKELPGFKWIIEVANQDTTMKAAEVRTTLSVMSITSNRTVISAVVSGQGNESLYTGMPESWDFRAHGYKIVYPVTAEIGGMEVFGIDLLRKVVINRRDPTGYIYGEHTAKLRKVNNVLVVQSSLWSEKTLEQFNALSGYGAGGGIYYNVDEPTELPTTQYNVLNPLTRLWSLVDESCDSIPGINFPVFSGGTPAGMYPYTMNTYPLKRVEWFGYTYFDVTLPPYPKEYELGVPPYPKMSYVEAGAGEYNETYLGWDVSVETSFPGGWIPSPRSRYRTYPGSLSLGYDYLYANGPGGSITVDKKSSFYMWDVGGSIFNYKQTFNLLWSAEFFLSAFYPLPVTIDYTANIVSVNEFEHEMPVLPGFGAGPVGGLDSTIVSCIILNYNETIYSGSMVDGVLTVVKDIIPSISLASGYTCALFMQKSGDLVIKYNTKTNLTDITDKFTSAFEKCFKSLKVFNKDYMFGIHWYSTSNGTPNIPGRP